MRVEIGLPQQVGHLLPSHVVLHQRHRHHQRHAPEPVLLDELQQFGAGVLIDVLREVAEHVLQHVGLPLRRGDGSQRFHEARLILLGKLAASPLLGVGHHLPEFAVGDRRVGHQRELVCGVEGDDGPDGPTAGEQCDQSLVGKHAFDEVLAQPRVAESPFFLDRQVRQPCHQRLREQAAPGTLAGPFRRVDLHPFHAAAGRVLLQHKAAQPGTRQFLGARRRVRHEPLGDVGLLLVQQEGDLGRVVAFAALAHLRLGEHQPHRLAWGAEAGFHLWADRHPLDVFPEGFHQERIPLMTGIEADGLAEQAG